MPDSGLIVVTTEKSDCSIESLARSFKRWLCLEAGAYHELMLVCEYLFELFGCNLFV